MPITEASEARSDELLAEIDTVVLNLQLKRFHWRAPPKGSVEARNEHWIDFCLTPRPLNARGCITGHAASGGYSRIGDILYVPSGARLNADADAGKTAQDTLICRIRNEHLNEMLERESWREHALRACTDVNSGAVKFLLSRLRDEIQNPGYASAILLESAAIHLAIELHRYLDSVDLLPTKRMALTTRQLKAIQHQIEATTAAPSIEDLAKATSLSASYLMRAFKVTTGETLGAHIARCRHEKAKQMLSHTRLSISSIATELGFANSSAFAFAFRKYSGCSPRIFRQNHNTLTVGARG
ncbi:MAG: helix-turn-helix transcriptional regulator [Caulobacterales bacterium]